MVAATVVAADESAAALERRPGRLPVGREDAALAATSSASEDPVEFSAFPRSSLTVVPLSC
ncbi:hypothetical protein G419_14984 [Rhodococcus triatomae BKS 15-14]|nr:hypothetical protein G419_14984 [Rhodococcus triatomae BKS 15-14]